jgi:hypothetical protein
MGNILIPLRCSLQDFERARTWFFQSQDFIFGFALSGTGTEILFHKEDWFSRWVEPSRPRPSTEATVTVDLMEFDGDINPIQALEICRQKRIPPGIPMHLLMLGEQCPDLLPAKSFTAALLPLASALEGEQNSVRIPVLQRRSRGRFILNHWYPETPMDIGRSFFLASPS